MLKTSTARPHGRYIARALPTVLSVLMLGTMASTALASIGTAKGGAAEDTEIFIDGMEEFVLLQGEARFLHPLANAQVVVSGGGNMVSTTADEDGLFYVKFTFGNPRGIVEVRARGEDAQAHEEYASYLGDQNFLLERAGDDRTLNVADLPALRLNPFHTGLYVAMRDIPALPPSSNVPDFERRARSFSTIDFRNRAPLIAALAAGDLDLPSGAATTLEVMSDEALAFDVMVAVEQLPGLCPENPLCIASERTGNDPDQVPVLPPPTGVTLQSYLSPGLGSSSTSSRVHLNADGTGELLLSTHQQTDKQAIAWAVVDGDVVRITAEDGNPLNERISYDYFSDCSCQHYTVYATLAIRLLFAEGPAGVVLVGHSDEIERRYPENPEIPTVPATIYRPSAIYPNVSDDAGFSGGFADPGNTKIVLPRCLDSLECAGRPPISSFSPGSLIDEPHHFHAGGTGVTLRLGEEFTWSRDMQGRLHVDYASGAQALFVSAALPTAVTGTTTGWFRTAAGVQMAISGDHVVIQGEPAFSAANASGTYMSMINKAYPYGSLGNTSESMFGFVLSSGGIGNDYDSSRPITWNIDPQGRLSFVRENISALPSSLYPQRRNWELLGRAGNSIYVLESVQTPDPITGELSATPDFGPTSRLVRYDNID